MATKGANQKISLDDELRNILTDCRYRNGQLIVTSCSKRLVELATKLHGANFEGIDFQQTFYIILDVLTKPKYRYRGKVPQDDIGGIVATIAAKLRKRNQSLSWYIALPCVSEINLDISLGQGVNIVTVSKQTIALIDDANKLTNLTPVQPELFDEQYDEELLLHDDRENTPQYEKLDNSGLMYLRVNAKGFASNQLVSTLDTDPVHVWKIIIAMLITSDVLFDFPAMKYLGGAKYAKYLGKVSVFEPDTMIFAGSEDRPSNEIDMLSRLTVLGDKSTEQIAVFDQIKMLISPMSNTYLEAERIKIINSLYWLFQSYATDNMAFRVLMFVSMFDSFSKESDNKTEKTKTIISLLGKKSGSKEHDILFNLYDKRNKIAHGQVHLLDIHVGKDRHILSPADTDAILKLYKEYIRRKVALLLG